MSDSRHAYLKTVWAIILKFLSGTNLTLKVNDFDGFVNQSSTAHFMITKTSIGVIYTNFFKKALISI